jgi:N-acetylmuramoyl-L-alanine amidase
VDPIGNSDSKQPKNILLFDLSRIEVGTTLDPHMKKRKRSLKRQSYEPLEPRRLLTCNHVVIDPGHGGNSSADDLSGSTWNDAISTSGILEKDLALELGERVRQSLVDRGYEVSMTRTENVNLSAADRAAVARDQVDDDTKQVFFLSLHFNRFNGQRRGTETFYADNLDSTNFNLEQDKAFAGIIQKSLLAATRQFGGVDRAIQPDSTAANSSLEVLSDVNFGNTADRHAVLSALAEIEFIDNPDVDTILADADQREVFFGEIARALAAGIEKAHRSFCDQANIVQVIDRSGSGDNDNRFVASKDAAINWVGQMEDGERIGIVSFAPDASIDFELTEITDQNIRDDAIEAINALESEGFTAIGEGVRLADSELDRFPAETNRVMIVMTDGNQNRSEPPLSVIDSEVDQDIRIFTIGIGDGISAQRLRSMASSRNGEFFNLPSGQNLDRIQQIIRDQINGAITNLNAEEIIQPRKTQQTSFLIDPSTTSTTIGVLWPDGNLDLEVVSPSGKVYSSQSAEDQTEATFESGSSFESLEIELPETGYWIARIIGEEVPEDGTIYDLLVQSHSMLATSATTSNDLSETTNRFETGETITLSVAVEDEQAVDDADVVAKITSPSGLVFRVTLFDDATGGDQIAGDGVYTGRFDEVNTAGSFDIQYEITGESSFQFPFIAVDSSEILASGEDVINTTAPYVTNVYSEAELIGNASPHENILLIARFVDVDAGEIYSATIDWGDNSQESLTVEDIGNRFEIRGNHQYASPGRFPVTIAISDGVSTTTATNFLYVSGVSLYGNTIFVVGTHGRDDIKIFDRGSQLEVVSTLEGQNESSQRFAINQVSRVRVYSGPGDDTVISQSERIPLQAWLGDGNDRAVGSQVNDFILGESGDDVVYGRGGDDRINAGRGNDQIFGGHGNDFLAGGNGDDLIYGGLGNDTLIGLAGNDRLLGQNGNDLILAGAGDDQAWGGDDDDEIYGSFGMDRIIGGLGADRLFGNEDSDELFGSPGDDFLDGGLGTDLLVGGPGDDEEING